MSFIRKRQKNILLAGISGFFVALMLLSVTYFIFIRGNVAAIDWLLEDSQLEVNTMPNTMELEIPQEVVMADVYTLIEGVAVDTVIEEQMIMKLSIEDRFVPRNAFRDKEEIVGKKASIDIDSIMILTESMLFETGTDYIVSQTAEIQNIHVPDLLQVGDDVNLRIHFPSGQDYVVIEGKEVLKIHEEYNGLYLDLWEDEILAYSSALVDCQIYPGTYLYLTKQQWIIGDENSTSFSQYPVNPNVWTLAANSVLDKTENERLINGELNWEESGNVLLERMFLDISLSEYYDDDFVKYRYGYEELANQEIDLNQLLNQLEWGNIQERDELGLDKESGLESEVDTQSGIRAESGASSESESETQTETGTSDDLPQDNESSVGF